MKYSIVYSSLTGNTKLLGEEIYKKLNKEDCIYCGELSDKSLEADFIYVGFWTDKGTCDSKCQEFLKKLRNKDIFLFGTAGFGVTNDYFEDVISKVKENIDSSVTVKDYFMCQGKMGIGVRKRYEATKLANPDTPNIDMLIANFDEALKHPNEEDLEKLDKKILSL